MSGDGERLLSASADGTAAIWDTGAGAQIGLLPSKRAVTAAAFAPGAHVVLAGTDRDFTVWTLGG